MKNALKMLGLLTTVLFCVSCAKAPEQVNEYFPLVKNKVTQMKKMKDYTSDKFAKQTRIQTFKTLDFQKEGDGATAVYQREFTSIKTTYHLKVDAKSVVVVKQTSELNGKEYPEAAGRVLLMVPGPAEKLSHKYKWGGTDMSCLFYRGKAENASKTYPDCVILDERMTGKETNIHTRSYYQKGVGCVREEFLNPDGTVDEYMVRELVE